jgi:hypothetical protein
MMLLADLMVELRRYDGDVPAVRLPDLLDGLELALPGFSDAEYGELATGARSPCPVTRPAQTSTPDRALEKGSAERCSMEPRVGLANGQSMTVRAWRSRGGSERRRMATICRIYLLEPQVVRHVVARVAERRGEARVDPDRVHAQPGQVVQVVDDPRQVANPVAVAVGKALRVDLVDDGLV